MKLRLRHILGFTPRRLAGSMAGIGITLALVAVVLGRQTGDAELANYEGLTPDEMLVTAARNGDQVVVERLLADHVDVNSVANVKGERTALSAATATNQLAMIRALVAKGADVRLQPEKGDAPLVVALKKGWRECADELRGKGATCEPELLAAATGDAPAVATFLASHPSFEKLKALCEIAAANGHADVFAAISDAIRAQPAHGDWQSGHGLASVAIAHGHRAVVEEMLKRGEDLNKSEVMRLGPVAGQSPGMREWLKAKGFTVPEFTDSERLIEATERENLPEMRRLLAAAGVDVNYRGESKWTPLTKAATWGCPRAVRLLLDHRADPNLRKTSGDPGYTVLELAKTPEIADMLLAAGAKVFPEAISYPAGTGSVEMTRWFLDHGVDPQAMKDGGESLLIEAPKPEVVQVLLAHGARVRTEDRAKLAEQISHAWTIEGAELLIEAGADLSSWDQFGTQPLIRVLHARSRPADLIAVLLKHGADPNGRTKDGCTPLMFAKDADTIDVLVGAGADLYAVSNAGMSVADFDFGSSRNERKEALARYGIRDDAFMETYRRAGRNVGPLSFAAGRGDVEKLNALLAEGADVNEPSERGCTPLHFAVRCGQVAAARWLMEHGAEVNAFDATGMSPAQEVYTYGNLPIRGMSESDSAAEKALSDLLPKEKIDPRYRDAHGETALMRAAASRSWSIEALLAAGPQIDAQRPDGMTPLMLVVSSPPPEDGSVSTVTTPAEPGKEPVKYSLQGYIVHLLLSKGADTGLRNKAGKTVFEMTRKSGDEEIVKLLKSDTR